MSNITKDEKAETEKFSRTFFAFLFSTLLYPIPVIAAMTMMNGEVDGYLFNGYIFALVLGFGLNLLIGLPLHFFLEKVRLTRLYQYVLAGSFVGTVSTYILFRPDRRNAWKWMSDELYLGALSGLCLAGLYWLFYYRKMERRFARLDALILTIAVTSVAAMGLARAHEKHRAVEHFKAKRAWIYEMDAPNFDRLSGPAPLTVTMQSPTHFPKQGENCAFGYYPPLTKRPQPNLTRYVVWDENAATPMAYDARQIYVSEHQKHCFWEQSHIYVKPGRYVIKLYANNHVSFNKTPNPEHELEVIVTAPVLE